MILKNTKIEDLEKLCEKLNGDLIIANSEKERLTAELQNLISEYTKRSEKAEEEATEKLNATEDILQNLVKKVEMLSKNKETVDLKLVSQKTENEKLKAELQDAHLKIQKSGNQSVSGDLMELSEEVDRLQAEIGTSKSLLRQKDIMIKDLKISLEEQIRSSNRFEAENEKLISELSERDLDMKIQEEELQKTTMKIEELGKQNSEQLENFKNDIKFYKSKVSRNQFLIHSNVFQVIEFEGKAAKFKEIEKEHSKIGNMQNLQNRIVELEQQLNFQTERSKELEIKNTDLSEFITFLTLWTFYFFAAKVTFFKNISDSTVEKLMTDETGLVTKVITEETTETITTTRACPSRKYDSILYSLYTQSTVKLRPNLKNAT